MHGEEREVDPEVSSDRAGGIDSEYMESMERRDGTVKAVVGRRPRALIGKVGGADAVGAVALGIGGLLVPAQKKPETGEARGRGEPRVHEKCSTVPLSGLGANE